MSAPTIGQRNPPGAGRPSVVIRLGGWIAAIATLAAISILASITVVELSSGEARAINMAGALRMHSYAIQSAVGLDTGDVRYPLLAQAVTDFEARYTHPDLLRVIPVSSDDPVRQAYESVGNLWRNHFRPAAQRAGPDAEARLALQADTTQMVAHIDRLVALVEDGLETKLQALRLVQGISLALLLIVGASAVIQLKTYVLNPLSELLGLAKVVRRGNFSQRVTVREPDELGQLGEAFNFMVEDLSRSYAELENRVMEKTEELARSNQSLNLLYRTIRALSERAVSKGTLQQVLQEVAQVIGIRAGVLCLTRADGMSVVVQADPEAPLPEAELCRPEYHACNQDSATQPTIRMRDASPDEWNISVPLFDGMRSHGAMLLQQADCKHLDKWQIELLEAVGRHIGNALATTQRNEERHRLALLDERSVIARELHDSLAQSLSYLKIQVTRLQNLLGPQPRPEPVNEVVGELRDGLNEAYRQLRELLTTFRLRIDGRGLPAAIDDTVQDFRRRTGLNITLENNLSSIELPPHREIHVLQIIREALSNIERHAEARHVSVTLRNADANLLTVSIEDDGIGFDENNTPMHRYGIVIMRDRAQNLEGDLKVLHRNSGGTRVELTFPNQPVLQDAPPINLGSPQ
ncbi:MAG: histidine kinase [Zoogloea sp.]|uniref:histidine kinase n=1 Tax=Zoogloea sp. TaxID=49181 RepID=UPI0026128E35|nr:histidine kinase [Zoogloea sp.]MDD2991662.1 histidine kinase [Zoogloea sp.]